MWLFLIEVEGEGSGGRGLRGMHWALGLDVFGFGGQKA